MTRRERRHDFAAQIRKYRRAGHGDGWVSLLAHTRGAMDADAIPAKTEVVFASVID
jgi:hypothetical protein